MYPAQRLGKRGELQGLFLAEDRPARPGLQLVHPTISAIQPLFYPALFLEAVRRRQAGLPTLGRGRPELVAGRELHCPSSDQTCWRVASRLVRWYGLSCQERLAHGCRLWSGVLTPSMRIAVAGFVRDLVVVGRACRHCQNRPGLGYNAWLIQAIYEVS